MQGNTNYSMPKTFKCLTTLGTTRFNHSLQSLKKKSYEVIILANEVPFNELFAAKNTIQAKKMVLHYPLCDVTVLDTFHYAIGNIRV